jgi:hypothetical protein
MVFCPSLEIKNRNKIGCHVIRNALHEIKVDATSFSPLHRRRGELQPSDTDL